MLESLRREFPQPVSDRVHDAYVAFSVLRALDRVDELKSAAPILGSPVTLDFDAARQSRVAKGAEPLETVVSALVKHLEGMFIWGHPRSQINVVSHPSIASIIGVLLASTYNPNLVSDESGRGFSTAEVRAMAMAAELVGYDPERSGGTFTFGGTGCMLYGVKVGLEKAVPGCINHGQNQPAVVLASEHSHACSLNVAGWLGIGQQNVLMIKTHQDNSIDVDLLREAAHKAIGEGRRIAAFIATMGSTDAFGLDDLAAIHALRDELVSEFSLDYKPHIHADAVIGWAWSVFNDYHFAKNPLGFRGRTVRALAKAHHRLGRLSLADSIGIDFHKTGFAPYISSLVLFRDRKDLQFIFRPR
ncbi:MAG TPA: pyridoxal-dependent decarboxylase, partial [Pirellulales bacterium]